MEQAEPPEWAAMAPAVALERMATVQWAAAESEETVMAAVAQAAVVFPR